MKHTFVSAKAEGSDPSLVGPTEWNEVHTLGVTALSANTSLTSAHDYVRATGGAGGIILTLPAASSSAGLTFKIKKIDSGVGAVTVAANSGDHIDGSVSYVLGQQYQFVEVSCDGAVWDVTGRN